MKRFLIVPLALLGMMMLHWSAGRASAQYFGGVGAGRINRPVVSPYLRLLQGGGLTNNYWNGVVPQVNYGNAIQQLNQQVTTNQQALTGLQEATLAPPTTGHPVGFQTQGTYFQTFGRAAAGRAAAGGRVAQTRGVGRTGGGGMGGMATGGRAGAPPMAGR